MRSLNWIDDFTLCMVYAGSRLQKVGVSVEFKLAKVIPGFKQALTQMHIGEKWKIYVHPSLGYGESVIKGSIGANEMLIFDLELLAITHEILSE